LEIEQTLVSLKIRIAVKNKKTLAIFFRIGYPAEGGGGRSRRREVP
jgi:hypothetical protein